MARNKFDVDEELETSFSFQHLKRLLSYMRPYRKEIIVTVSLMFLANIASLMGPYLIKIAMDDKIPNKDIKGLSILAVIFLFTLVVTGVCMKLRIRSMSRIGQNVLKQMRLDLFTNLQRLPFSYYDNRPHGKILVRVVNYINSLSDLLSNGLINLITDSLSLFMAIGFMIAIDVKLTLISIVLIPVLLAWVLILKKAQRKAYQILSSKQSNMNAYIHESINGIKVTQSFAREEENLRIFREVCDNYRTSWLRAVRIQFLLWPSVEIISTLTVSLIYIAGIYYLASEVSIGILVAFVGYVWRFWNPILNIGNFYNSIITAMAYLERIFEAMDEKPLVTDLLGASEMETIKGDVEFRNITFAYEEDKPILKNINFKVKAGETIALVGPTGAGKTTIVNLLSRFYNIENGQVLIDGTNISNVKLQSLRKQMGVMLQDSFIFSGTIMDNIRYGKLDATDEEVINAAKIVRADDFISQLKEGYNTEVNERGTRLSVGQRQLISFARALLADPKILILDEATSSIDTKTEMLLQEGLDNLLKGRTSFIIAHRLSTIKNSSQIMFIDNGTILEHGTHDELIKLKGSYYKLYNSQFDIFNAV
ncbi:ABC transporter ATP-binding protein [Clostridium manihotivorum]|uniref:Multidrug ABC transporter ATP-binding protein n=1 Tax=Clostridium manihotivorum TaxID=2320868 RepID=A0A3R5U869_9CLOT|nr:ABC transporter ATP-binding protein [Clostridium manihotivorum]QAA31497.1 multidrug ABC transporter ATP-binding protein [Clostridium manihotivorum]